VEKPRLFHACGKPPVGALAAIACNCRQLRI
jgi:hypothetical protein